MVRQKTSQFPRKSEWGLQNLQNKPLAPNFKGSDKRMRIAATATEVFNSTLLFQKIPTPIISTLFNTH